MEKEFIIFGSKRIRRILYNEEWYFSVVDIIEVLTDSVNSNDYWYRLKIREKESSETELSTFCRQLKLKASDGKEYLTDCANLKGIFRIIQSVPSKKAEPLKRWLAKVGYDRIQEIQNSNIYKIKISHLISSLRIASMIPGDRKVAGCLFSFSEGGNF